MKKLTAKGIEKYLISNYGKSKHNEIAMKEACVKLAKELNVTPLDVFFYMIGENNTIPGYNLRSYGFDNAEGRYIKEKFSDIYYDIE